MCDCVCECVMLFDLMTDYKLSNPLKHLSHLLYPPPPLFNVQHTAALQRGQPLIVSPFT